MKKLLLHMGDAKTGTTSIQKLLASHRNELQQAGVLYPLSGRDSDQAIGHHKLARILVGTLDDFESQADPVWRELQEEIEASPLQHILISSEGFSSIRTSAQAAYLNKVVGRYEPTFLVFIRRPDRWLESIYAQFVKAPPYVKSDLPTFAKRFQLTGITAASILADEFGTSAVKVALFPEGSSFNEVPRSFFSEVEKMFGKLTENLPLDVYTRENVTDGPELLAIFHSLNSVDMSSALRRKIYERIRLGFPATKSNISKAM